MKEQNKKYLNLKKFKKQVKGITLIALVVTIIVLLILAGIALNLTIGQNGIFQRAQDAANTWKNAETNEQLAIGEGTDLIDQYLNGNGNDQGLGGEYNTGTTVSEAKNQNKFFEKDTTIKDDLDNDVRVPEGFKIAEDSATKVEEGVVIEDKDGNQFVWIPAKTGEGATVHTTKGDKTIEYTRTAYGDYATGEIDEKTNSEKIQFLDYHNYDSDYFTEALPTDEEVSVNANGGYYIGRYEAGWKEATDEKMMTEEYEEYFQEYLQETIINYLNEYAKENGIDMTDINNLTEEQIEQIYEKIYEIQNEKMTITIKKNQAPMETGIDSAKELAGAMANKQGYKTSKTKLASSYAWDTTISLTQITNEDYGISSIEGNYYDTKFDYTDITGAKKTKDENSILIVPTGQTTAVCNIYDMGGNLWEYTTESYYGGYGSKVVRGSVNDSVRYSYINSGAGMRGNCDSGNNGLRITLFLQ